MSSFRTAKFKKILEFFGRAVETLEKLQAPGFHTASRLELHVT